MKQRDPFTTVAETFRKHFPWLKFELEYRSTLHDDGGLEVPAALEWQWQTDKYTAIVNTQFPATLIVQTLTRELADKVYEISARIAMRNGSYQYIIPPEIYRVRDLAIAKALENMDEIDDREDMKAAAELVTAFKTRHGSLYLNVLVSDDMRTPDDGAPLQAEVKLIRYAGAGGFEIKLRSDLTLEGVANALLGGYLLHGCAFLEPDEVAAEVEFFQRYLREAADA